MTPERLAAVWQDGYEKGWQDGSIACTTPWGNPYGSALASDDEAESPIPAYDPEHPEEQYLAILDRQDASGDEVQR